MQVINTLRINKEKKKYNLLPFKFSNSYIEAYFFFLLNNYERTNWAAQSGLILRIVDAGGGIQHLKPRKNPTSSSVNGQPPPNSSASTSMWQCSSEENPCSTTLKPVRPSKKAQVGGPCHHNSQMSIHMSGERLAEVDQVSSEPLQGSVKADLVAQVQSSCEYSKPTCQQQAIVAFGQMQPSVLDPNPRAQRDQRAFQL